MLPVPMIATVLSEMVIWFTFHDVVFRARLSARLVRGHHPNPGDLPH
jgi:hypothetical protein